MTTLTDADEIPTDADQIPDRWNIMADPTNVGDGENFSLDYGRDDGDSSDPTATIDLQTPATARGPEEGYAVEVQDANADGPIIGYLNPQAVNERFDLLVAALERLHELADHYPLPETRE